MGNPRGTAYSAWGPTDKEGASDTNSEIPSPYTVVDSPTEIHRDHTSIDLIYEYIIMAISV